MNATTVRITVETINMAVDMNAFGALCLKTVV